MKELDIKEEQILNNKKVNTEVERIEESKRDALNEAYSARTMHQTSDVVITFDMQDNLYDKVLHAVVYGAKDISVGAGVTLDIETLKKNNMAGNKNREDDDLVDQLSNNSMRSVLNNGTKDDIKKALEIAAMMYSKASYDIGTYYKSMYDSLKDEPDEKKRHAKAYYLTKNSYCMGMALFMSIQANVGAALETLYIEKKSKYDKSIVSDIDLDNITIAEFAKSLNYNEDETAELARDFKASPDDKVLDAELIKRARKSNPRRENEELNDYLIRLKSDEENLLKAKQNLIDDYVKVFKVKSGEEIYKKYAENLGSKERELFNIGKDLGFGNDIHVDENVDISDWIEHEGEAMAESLRSKNIVKNFKLFEKASTYKKPLDFKLNKGISEFFKESREAEMEKCCDAGAVEWFVNNLTHGTEDLGGHKDSKQYTKMIESMKDYCEATFIGSAGRADIYKKEMVKSALAYIKGKKSVRHHEYGQDRFDAAMAILSKFMEPDKFKAVVDRVNEVRGTGFRRLKSTESKQLVTVEYYQVKFTLNRQRFIDGERTRQESAANDIESIYNDGVKNAIDSVAEHYNDIKVLSPIGVYDKNSEFNKLSRRDFISLAETYRAINKTDKEVTFEEAQTFVNNAMKEYAAGNKSILGNLIADGILNISAKMKECKEFDRTVYEFYSEVSHRITNMLERDKELNKLVLGSGVTKKDIGYVRDIWHDMRAILNADEACEELNKGVISPREKIKCAIDIVMVKVIDLSIKVNGEKVNPMDPTAKTELRNYFEKEGYENKSCEEILELVNKPDILAKVAEANKPHKDQDNVIPKLAGVKSAKETGIKNRPLGIRIKKVCLCGLSHLYQPL